MDATEHLRRRRAWEAEFPWRFEQLPETVGRPPAPNAMRNAAIFVVHGIGDQAPVETAIQFRHGIEDAIEDLIEEAADAQSKTALGGGAGVLYVPYVAEGYWGDYHDFEGSFAAVAGTLSPGERQFFTRLWAERSGWPSTAAWWFFRQTVKLLWPRPKRKTPVPAGSVLDGAAAKKRFSPFRGIERLLISGGVMVISLPALVALYLWPRGRRVLATVLGDVRFYLEPRGVAERAAVQQIDRQVGEQFLRLLGVDWAFHDLPHKDRLRIGGRGHRFTHVTWLAHSLGTVISYNVVSDILWRMEACEQEFAAAAAAGRALTAEQQERQRNVERVRAGLHRFFTIGSPLGKVGYLYPDALRPWPAKQAEKLLLDAAGKPRNWWVNFFHIWDPVSGVAENNPECAAAQSVHKRSLLGIPGFAHVSYWRDAETVKYVVTRAYGPEVVRMGKGLAELFRTAEKMKLLRRLSALALVGIGIGGILLAGWLGWPVAKRLLASPAEAVLRLLGL